MIDAFAKWQEAYVVISTSAFQTIDKMRRIFATHGLPIRLVSDNGPPFTPTQFATFMKANGILLKEFHCIIHPQMD